MSDIDRIVQVTITRQTTTPSIASFSDALVAAEFLTTDVTPNYGSTERVRLVGKSEYAVMFASVQVVLDALTAFFSQNPSVTQAYVGRKLTAGEGTETWTEALTAMAADNNAWYGIIAGTRTLADQQLVATYAEANEKLYVAGSNDSNIPDGTGDIAEYANTNSLDRTAIIYHPDADLSTSDPYPDAAWMGKMFPKDPGSATWDLKTLATVPVYELSTGQQDTVLGKNGNYYISVSDVPITQEGTVGSGEYIDIIRGVDWLKARIQQLVFTPLVQLDKVPFTNVGIQVPVGQLRAALREAVAVGLITEDFVVTFPDVSEVSATDKGNRLLPDVEFTATLAGAIHKTQISGVVSL